MEGLSIGEKLKKLIKIVDTSFKISIGKSALVHHINEYSLMSKKNKLDQNMAIFKLWEKKLLSNNYERM